MMIFSVAGYGLISLFVLTIAFAKSREAGKAALVILIVLPFFVAAFSWFIGPTRPSRSEIIGKYEIDRRHYPGPNADWQHQTYELEITKEELIVRDSRTSSTWSYPISWFGGSRYRWVFKNEEKRHHLVAEGPALYRRMFSYYYVFRSPLYGDVFFCKSKH